MNSLPMSRDHAYDLTSPGNKRSRLSGTYGSHAVSRTIFFLIYKIRDLDIGYDDPLAFFKSGAASALVTLFYPLPVFDNFRIKTFEGKKQQIIFFRNQYLHSSHLRMHNSSCRI